MHSSSYDNFIVLDDFNVGMGEVNMSNFCSIYDLKRLIEDPTCLKNLQKPTVIGLILTNHLLSFLNFCIVGTGLSYFPKIVLTVFKMAYKKLETRALNYRVYKKFNTETFRKQLLHELSHNDNLEEFNARS